MVDTIVYGLASLTLASQVCFAAILIAWLLERMRIANPIASLVASSGLTLMLTVAIVATAGSLFLSDIAGWTPCKLCWYQRIFMYPQVILLGIALWKKDRNIALHILLLSIIGALIAGYHYSEQVMAALTPADPLKPCDTTGTSCASTPFFRFGYITIPMMALTAFALNALCSILIMRRKISAR